MSILLNTIRPRFNLRKAIEKPEIIIVLIVMCGFMLNVQQGYNTNGVLRSDPLLFKGIRILTILAAQVFAIWVVIKRKIPQGLCLTGPMLPLVMYLCACLLSVPFSPYPMMSLFKVSEIFMVVLLCIIGLASKESNPRDLFNLNIKIVFLYNIIIWVESILFPNIAWVRIRGQMPFFSHALSGVFPVINGNMVGLFGAVLFLAYLPRIWESGKFRLLMVVPVLVGLASTVCSYSRSSLLGLVPAAFLSLLLMKKYTIVLIVIACLVLAGTSYKARVLVMDHLARGNEERTLDTLTSNRIEMWDYVLEQYHTSVFGRGYAAGFRYDDTLTDGHAHNSLVELYFDVGLLGVLSWLTLIVSVYSYLYFLLRLHTVIDFQLISVLGVMSFLFIKAIASTVFVHLDQSMFILAAVIVYAMRRVHAVQCAGMNMQTNYSFSMAN
ncbi:MAG: O-antigen ligase family protein [Sedimentisphaerales bacterium]